MDFYSFVKIIIDELYKRELKLINRKNISK